MKERIKEKGITLTALVVTIIILLILATITIRAITGDNGIIRKTGEAVNAYKIAENKEQETLEYLYGELNPNQEITISLGQLRDIIKEEINESKKEDKLNAYPVGSIYISSDATDPSELFGGTWEKYGQGRTLIGEGTSDKTFTAGETGGESLHTLTVEEMPSHAHDFIHGGKALCVYTNINNAAQDLSSGYAFSSDITWYGGCNKADSRINESGGSQSHNNLQPYIVTYMWKRVS